MQAEDVLQVLDALAAAGIAAFVDGGWGVDALLGEQTREHDDLDLQLPVNDVERAAAVLGALGFDERLSGGRPANFVLRARGDRRVDLHAITFDSHGGGVYELEDGSSWQWPAGSFSGEGRIEGRPVRCLSPGAQVLAHGGYELDEADWHDLARLRARFGVEGAPGPRGRSRL